jgi:hypothetical protein
MDLSQTKLTKSEWDYLELPVNKKEKAILQLLFNSRKDINVSFNNSNSLLKYMKISNDNLEPFHYYVYMTYFQRDINKINRSHDEVFRVERQKKTKLKKIDEMRMKNLNKKILILKKELYEFIIIKNIKLFFENNYSCEYYYTLTQLLKNNITKLNIYVLEYVNMLLVKYKGKIKYDKLIKNAHAYIERNDTMLKYSDVKLYEHQQKILNTVNNENNFMVLYQAPTGTGKTLTPLGIKKRIIFVCAAKHIGLQLAKSCISTEIPIAIAFGCRDTSDIRLHYFAAKDIIRNRRTGGIFRVDNMVGDKVEVIISDVQSYLYAMRYMLAFNEPSDLLWYWDEPTITLDYENHEFHNILQKNWKENEIPNIVLSSATLPDDKELYPMIMSYQRKFENGIKINVVSYECQKTIPILKMNGETMMPHFEFDNCKDLKRCVKYLNTNKTMLRHFDVNEISRFIIKMHKKGLVKDAYEMNNYFEDISEINIMSLKLYYLKLLSKMKENDLQKIRKHLTVEKEHNSVIKITTNDAHTLTDGPTIFITNDVKKIAKFYLKVSNIPEKELIDLMNIIVNNDYMMKEIERATIEEDQRLAKIDEKKLDKEVKENTREKQYQEDYIEKIRLLKSKLLEVQLKKRYIPNSPEHFKLWCEGSKNKGFASELDDEVVQKIMLLEIDREWKILLMMGIGVFTTHDNLKYVDIMKKMAEQQKLYLIIASSDYIYGTNYQFCHGYLSKDLKNMTQEKMIQAFGRVGRQDKQKNYSVRLRDDKLIEKILFKEEDKMEVKNMNKLFSC